jgi:hypothetical protein
MQIVTAGQDGYFELLLMQSDGSPVTTGSASFYLRNAAGQWWTGTAWGSGRVVAAAGAYVSASAWACTIDAGAFTADGRYHIEAVHATISHLPATDNVVCVIKPVGSGADQVTITLTNGAQAVADAMVWISSDAAGATVVSGTLRTNSSGQAKFLLTDGVTYYLWASKIGWNGILGTAFVAHKD